MDTLDERLDGSFGDGPPLPPVAVHVLAGRRALRRRRVAGGATVLAAATVMVTTWYAAVPGETNDSDLLAGIPGSSATSSISGATGNPSIDPSETPWSKGELIRYVAGELEVRPGVVVHEQIHNPYRYEQPSLSDALDVTWNGHRQWLIIEKRPLPQGISSSSSDPSNGWASFADYVAEQVDINGDSGWPNTFRIDDQGRVVPTALTRVIDRTDDPRLGPDFAAPGATTGAAVVSVVGEEGNYFVVWRVIDGTLDVITTAPTFNAGATFDELLSRARARYASGEGLR